ncbi:MAG: bifunctional DNA-formamidopyrimidine glycosylase/DNA-(apurinic or apyrimidinic site) lyase [Granulosicoccus sp.]|nr:bifunctional DNA-formamidopyrimidine glycosylase/DNA-(apurinic or apyrimidinic site) lyase [Granulosicoccus sp.]
MPELPEVETTRRGIEPYLVGQEISKLSVHEKRLRWPVTSEVKQLEHARISAVERRGKYILIQVPAGCGIIHLGMSGSLRICTGQQPRRKHDHIEMTLTSGDVLRFHDPRRFGCFLWQSADAYAHELLKNLGPEPLSEDFHNDYLFQATRNRRVAIKNLIMNSHVVVGVGNIYACEALHMAGVRPGRAARRVSRNECSKLVQTIKCVLQQSITQGGTTLRDFVNSDGSPGYFAQSLRVYGRKGEDCRICKHPVKHKVIGQRSTYYCSHCQV